MQNTTPTEAHEQMFLFQWAELNKSKYPQLKLLHAIPNGGSRNPREGHNLKMQGVKAGVPDMCLPVARGQFHGLYIELKRKKGSSISTQQKSWIKNLSEQGYMAIVCYGFEQAKESIEIYLNQK